MINTYTHKNLTWVDLASPTREEVREVMERYHLDPLSAEELLIPTLKPKVDLYRDYIYLILHFPAIKHTHSGEKNQEVDFIIGRDFLITTRYDTIDPLHKFSKVFEVNSILDRSDIGEHAGFIFFYMIKKLYKALIHELDYMSDSLGSIEHRIFSGHEREMVFELSSVSRDLLRFEQALRLHREVLSSFEVAARKLFGEEFNYHLKSINGAYYQVADAVDGNTAILNELRQTNNSLLSTKQNETMKVLAIISFVILPLTLISQIFSMSTVHTPLVGMPNDFWNVIGIMALTGAAITLYFNYRKWF